MLQSNIEIVGERHSLCLRAILTVLVSGYKLRSISVSPILVAPEVGGCSFVSFFDSSFPRLRCFFLPFLFDLPSSSHPINVSPLYSSKVQSLVTLQRDLLRSIKLVNRVIVLLPGQVLLTPPPYFCCLPLLAVLLVESHRLLHSVTSSLHFVALLGVMIGIGWSDRRGNARWGRRFVWVDMHCCSAGCSGILDFI